MILFPVMANENGAHARGDFLLTRRGVINPNRTVGDEIFDIAERLGVFERPLDTSYGPLAGKQWSATEIKVMRRLVLIEPGRSSTYEDMSEDLNLSREYVKNVEQAITKKLGLRNKVQLAVAVERSGMFS